MGTETRVENRKLVLCEGTRDWPVDDLVEECPDCHDFVLYFCACNNQRLRDLEQRGQIDRPDEPCHHYRLIFTDGACLNNGRPDAKAGAGVAMGSTEEYQWSIPITDKQDDFPVRTSQRAELFAAKSGLAHMVAVAELNGDSLDRPKERTSEWIIVTDSQYVFRGMTEWLPKWRSNGWRTSNGTEPANLDLFLALEADIKRCEKGGA